MATTVESEAPPTPAAPNNPAVPIAEPTTPAAPAAPITATVVQATEKVTVEGSTAVVTQIVKSTASDLKDIENNAAKEVVSASAEDAPSLVTKVEDGLQDVAKEVVKGAQSAVETVEQHPELIAEGTLAIAIGAVSLIQPELAAGEVAIIGKMASDSAKKTVTTIASDTSSKVVKAISKDLADDAKEVATRDASGASAKTKAEGGEGQAVPTKTVDAKPAPVIPGRDAPNMATPIITGAKPTSAPSPAPNDSNSAPAEPVKELVNGDATKPLDANVDPAKDDSSKDRIIAIEVAQEPSKTNSSATRGSSDAKPEPPIAAPISFKISLGADGEVKAITKDVTEVAPKIEDPTLEPEQVRSKTSNVRNTAKTSVSSIEHSPVVVDPLPSADQGASKTSTIEATTKSGLVSTKAAKDKPEMVQEASMSGSQPPTTSNKQPEEVQEDPKASDTSPAVPSPAIVSEVATVTSTKKTQTISETPVQDIVNTVESYMVTVSQESLDLLHRKIDTLHDAIQEITKVLAFHMPLPPGDSVLNAIKSTEDEINVALASAAKPLTDLLPEILLNNEYATHPPVQDPWIPKSSTKRPVPEKRTSVLGTIGKVFWPFGSSEKIATVTVTEVARSELGS